MNRKETHKHKKREFWKTWLVVGAFIAVFVSVLVAFLFALFGKDFTGIFGNSNCRLTVCNNKGTVDADKCNSLVYTDFEIRSAFVQMYNTLKQNEKVIKHNAPTTRKR